MQKFRLLLGISLLVTAGISVVAAGAGNALPTKPSSTSVVVFHRNSFYLCVSENNLPHHIAHGDYIVFPACAQ